MKYLGAILLTTLWMTISAQPYRPSHTIGFEARINRGSLKKGSNNDGVGPNLFDNILKFDILGQYDYAPFKWLGISTGIGVSARGGEGLEDGGPTFFPTNSKTTKELYYLNVPIRLQFKVGFFWLEPGIENLVFLGLKDGSSYGLVRKSLIAKDINNYQLSGTLAGRFNLFKGLSLCLGAGKNLMPVAIYQDDRSSKTNIYNNFYIFLGIRYMFDAP